MSSPTFPKSKVPSTLPPASYKLLVKLLALHKGYPLPYPLSGGHFEELFAFAIAGERETRKLTFDVFRAGVGWSLKTILGLKPPGSSFECVVQRCDILKDQSLTVRSPVPQLGKAILNHFNLACMTAAEKQGISDPRAGFLMRDRGEQNFIFFQQRYRLYGPNEVSWRWSNDASLIGTVNEKVLLRWYRSGTQLFHGYTIPLDCHSFAISGHRADIDKTLAFLKQTAGTETAKN